MGIEWSTCEGYGLMDSRFDTFLRLDQEKQQRIIKAALEEFGTKGFKAASTNAIAEAAHIGKGMLFYYFGSKEELFDFLCEYTIEFARNEFLGALSTDSNDFLERLMMLSEAKRKAMAQSPEVIGFFESFYQDEQAACFEKFATEIAEVRQLAYDKVYAGVDYTLFRDDIDGKTVVTYVKWLFASYEADIMARFKSGALDATDDAALAAEWAKFYEFTDNLRKIFYKEAR